MAKVVKKGKNPGAVDNWLDTLDLYRKNVAYDETCLFRAVSEQLFDCQVYHERVRKECIAYARTHTEKFVYLFETESGLLNHLDQLEKHMVVCGEVEINIISLKYSHDVIIFDAIHQQIYDATKRKFPKSLLLCLLDEDHYDVVYKREHIAIAGFCQSLIYKVLYEKVFKIPNVDDIVNNMLYEKNIITQAEIMSEKRKMLTETSHDEQEGSVLGEVEDTIKTACFGTNIAPFPFKVAKALDPSIYRNIEYDSWGEVRREMRLGEWYYGDDKLILGTKCIYNDLETNETHSCYIQEIIKDQNKCVVYLMELAQKKTVNYTDLSPENDAKPWPLPYRFTKNLIISGVPQPLSVENKTLQKPKKRNKDKKRTKSESSIISSGTALVLSEGIENVNAYVGAPLQMQNINETIYRTTEVSSETQTDLPTNHEHVTNLPDTPATPSSYSYESTQWHQYIPQSTESFVWPQPTPNMFNYNIKPVIASAPVTPDVVSYHDPNFPFFYNYHVEPYQNYNQWTVPVDMQPVPLRTTNQSPDEFRESTPHLQEQPNPQQVKTEVNYETQSVANTTRPKERLLLCTNLTPQSPNLEVYSPVIPMSSGTPVLYAPATPEMTEMVIPNTPVVYTAPMDLQYVSPGPYIYPPTPPTTWYSAGVTPQGFIFPQRRN